jgi:alkylation response protein AidB-like acyl-CoA dehydrogenase
VIFNEEQTMLQDTLRSFLADNAPVSDLRALRANPDGPAYNEDLWQQLVELGIPGIALSESDGGLGFGYMGLAAVLHEMGRNLVASPVVSSVALASSLIQLAGDESQKTQWLPRLARGEITATVAVQEGRQFALESLATRFDKGELSGHKTLVMDARESEITLVIAVTDDERLMAAIIPSLELAASSDRYKLMDGRTFSDIELGGLRVPKEALIGADGGCHNAIAKALDIGTLAISAEMIGGAESLLERTVAHLNDREQFDVKLATFQALQHRCAELYCQLELARSAVLSAFTRLDRGQDILRAASQCKALANDCYLTTSNEAVQMHGGMGITDELDIGLYLKRSRVCNQLLGDSSYHRDRYAKAGSL